MREELKKFNVDRVEDDPFKTILDSIRDVAHKHSQEILSEIGVLRSDAGYTSKQYELQYTIYHAVKASFKL